MSKPTVAIDLEKRLSTVEVQISSLASTVERYIDSASKHDAAVVEKLEQISGKVANQGKPNWGVLAAVFGVAMMIIGYYVSGVVNPVQTQTMTNTTAITTLQADMKEIIHEQYNHDSEEIIHGNDLAVMKKQWELWEKGLLRQPQ